MLNSEVEKDFKNKKKNKAAGKDLIRTEMLIAGVTKSIDWRTRMANVASSSASAAALSSHGGLGQSQLHSKSSYSLRVFLIISRIYQYYSLVNVAWHERKVHLDWQRAVLILLWKNNGSQRDCETYRGIFLVQSCL
jgi:hypothetical protein